MDGRFSFDNSGQVTHQPLMRTMLANARMVFSPISRTRPLPRWLASAVAFTFFLAGCSALESSHETRSNTTWAEYVATETVTEEREDRTTVTVREYAAPALVSEETVTTSTSSAKASSGETIPPVVSASPGQSSASGGAGEGTTTIKAVAKSTAWIGGLLILVGVAAAVASFMIPVIPLLPSLGIAGAGVCVLMLPAVVPYMGWILGGLAALAALAWWHNKSNEKRGQKKASKQTHQGATDDHRVLQ